MTALPVPAAAGLAEGERRRAAALAALAERRAALVRRAQRALLRQLLDTGEATADDVRAAVPLPDGIGPRCYGAVPLPLADAGIIRHAGYRPTRRPAGHARPIAVWALADRDAARAWLSTHPELPGPDPSEGDTWQPMLW
jgi:hypothetical protein